MEIKIIKLEFYPTAFNRKVPLLIWEAKHKDFYAKGEVPLPHYLSYDEAKEIKLAKKEIVRQVWKSYKYYLKSKEEWEKEAIKYPKLKGIVGEKIPESYILAGKLDE